MGSLKEGCAGDALLEPHLTQRFTLAVEVVPVRGLHRLPPHRFKAGPAHEDGHVDIRHHSNFGVAGPIQNKTKVTQECESKIG